MAAQEDDTVTRRDATPFARGLLALGLVTAAAAVPVAARADGSEGMGT